MTKLTFFEKNSEGMQLFGKKIVYISEGMSDPENSVLTERVFSFNTAATPGDERHTRPGGLTCR